MRAVVAADAEQAAQRPRQRRAQRDHLDRQPRAGRRAAAARRAPAAGSGRSAPREASRHGQRRDLAAAGRHRAHVVTSTPASSWRCASSLVSVMPCAAGLLRAGRCGLLMCLDLRLVSQFWMGASYGPAPAQHKNNLDSPIPGITRMSRPQTSGSAEAPAPPERGVKASTFNLLLDTAMALIRSRRPRPLGGRGGACMLEGVARHGLPLLPQPQRADHGGDRQLARAGAQLLGRRPGRARAAAPAVQEDLPALQGVRAAAARGRAAVAGAVGAGTRRPAGRRALPPRPPHRHPGTCARAAGADLPPAVRDRLHRRCPWSTASSPTSC